jgi:hypothetical protein
MFTHFIHLPSAIINTMFICLVCICVFFLQDTKEISVVMTMSEERKCLGLVLTNMTLAVNACTGEMDQQWTFAFINETAFATFDEIFGYESVVHL